MVIGIGTDVIEIARIGRSIERFGEAFLRRVYTEEEIAYCRGKRKGAVESFAARFAAKEAGAKALGTGISRGVSWTEFAVGRERGGGPVLRLLGRAGEIAGRLSVSRVSLSLTHGREVAMAVVLLEGAEILPRRGFSPQTVEGFRLRSRRAGGRADGASTMAGAWYPPSPHQDRKVPI